ncbi:MAG TPA: anthranilate phosphoribosyltransferase [Cyclobacteriaceae bacterium]|nr:anthranilate phosphoribosyltransferase [Cyclobacteriaceae bacterium]
MKDVLNDLISHKTLSQQAAHDILIELAQGKHNTSLVSAFMTVYMVRNITIDELAGFRDAMLDLCVSIKFDQPVMDLCGTGGDGKNTYNISTLASFIVAAAGQAVAKHGNYGVSSACGSSNLLQYFGYEFTNEKDKLFKSMEQCNIAFLHAPLFHPAMKHVAPIRKELGVKTFFNMLGPMVNPAAPDIQLVGVFNLELARQYAYLYQEGSKQFVIVHALDGYDEISLTGDFKIFSNQGEQLISPVQLGLAQVDADALHGGDTVEAAADIFLEVIQGRGSEAQRAAAIANAGMALFCANQQLSLTDAVQKAAEALDSGAAYQTFKRLMELNKK